MKHKAITIRESVITKPGNAEEFNIILPSNKNLNYLGPYSFDELMRFIEENKPESITLYTVNMHGETIISLIEHHKIRKYRPFIYDYIIHTLGRPRMIVIKLLYFK